MEPRHRRDRARLNASHKGKGDSSHLVSNPLGMGRLNPSHKGKGDSKNEKQHPKPRQHVLILVIKERVIPLCKNWKNTLYKSLNPSHKGKGDSTGLSVSQSIIMS